MCIGAFLWELAHDANVVSFQYGMIPAVLFGHAELPSRLAVIPPWATIFTSMFLHGGWMHLGGNMLFLWIFGDNIEKAIGNARFLVFYLVCGVAAGLAHIFFNSGSGMPTVGASGAISGILGGYLLMFPNNRVRVLTRGGVVAVPAMMMLGLWILTQFVNGIGEIARTDETGGIAYAAHIGGFVAGFLLVKLFAAGRMRRAFA